MEGGALQWGHEHVLVEILLLLVEDAIYWCKQARKWRGSRDNPTGAGVYSEMEVIRTTNPSSRAEIRKIQETRRGHWWNRKKCCYGMELYPDFIRRKLLMVLFNDWNYFADGTTLPMVLFRRWNYFTDGIYSRVDLVISSWENSFTLVLWGCRRNDETSNKQQKLTFYAYKMEDDARNFSIFLYFWYFFMISSPTHQTNLLQTPIHDSKASRFAL